MQAGASFIFSILLIVFLKGGLVNRVGQNHNNMVYIWCIHGNFCRDFL